MIKNMKKLKSKKIKQLKIQDDYKSFYKIFLISLLTIFSFFNLPQAIDYLKKNFTPYKIIVNASKQTFDETLTNKKNIIKKKDISKDLSSKDNTIFMMILAFIQKIRVLQIHQDLVLQQSKKYLMIQNMI